MTVSPSAVESLDLCALRAVLERRGARGPAAASSRSRASWCTRWSTAWPRCGQAGTRWPKWSGSCRADPAAAVAAARTRRALEAMLSAAETWIAGATAGRTLVGSECPAGSARGAHVMRAIRWPAPTVDPPIDARRRSLEVRRADRLDRRADGSAGRGGLQDRCHSAVQGRGCGERPARRLPAGETRAADGIGRSRSFATPVPTGSRRGCLPADLDHPPDDQIRGPWGPATAQAGGANWCTAVRTPNSGISHAGVAGLVQATVREAAQRMASRQPGPGEPFAANDVRSDRAARCSPRAGR